jgi:hypothetical protein
MISQFLSKLKTNLFGGPGNTGFADYPPSKVDDIGMSKTPTSSLDSDPLRFGTYQFPRDVFEEQQLGHYMIFYVNKQTRSKYVYGKTAKQAKQLKEAAMKVFTNADGQDYGYGGFVDLKGEAQKKIDYYTSRVRKTLGTFGRDDGKTVDLSEKDRNQSALQGISSVANTTTRISDSVALYLPANVSDTTTARYEDTPTGMLGVGATDLLRFAEAGSFKDYQQMGKIGGKLLKDFVEDAFKRAGGAMIEAFAGAEGAIPLANKVFGQADNPFIEVFFNSMGVRTFTYNFQFAPRNEDETAEIQQIIQLFRFHMAPELQAENSRYLTLPSEFDIHYMYKADNGRSYENDYYNRIGTCVLENVSTNYTPNGVRSFANGAPTAIKMDLTFRETETLTKEKINAGY